MNNVARLISCRYDRVVEVSLTWGNTVLNGFRRSHVGQEAWPENSPALLVWIPDVEQH